MLDAFSSTLLTPEIGSFGHADPSIQIGANRSIYDFLEAVTPNTPVTLFSLDASNARFIDPELTTPVRNAGGSWDYTSWIERAGFDVEKNYAALAARGPAADARDHPP